MSTAMTDEPMDEFAQMTKMWIAFNEARPDVGLAWFIQHYRDGALLNEILESALPEPRLTKEVEMIFDEIAVELAKAQAKFPDQHLPNGTSADIWGGDEISAKAVTDSKHKHGGLTWQHILYEEVCEAFAEENPVKLRAELIQVAAMA